MEIYISKTNNPEKEFKYIDYLTFGKEGTDEVHTVAPVNSEWTDDSLKQEIEIDGDENGDGLDTPLSALYGLRILDAQFCGPDGEEIHAEGDSVYDYIERKVGLYDGHGRYFMFTDTPDGPIYSLADKSPDASFQDFIGQVVDIYEDWLDEHGLTILNDDRDSEIREAMESGEYESEEEAREDMGLAHIYGEDYDRFIEAFCGAAGTYEQLPEAVVAKSVADGWAAAIADAFMELMEEGGVDSSGDRAVPSEEDRAQLQAQTLDTMTLWSLCGLSREEMDDPDKLKRNVPEKDAELER